VKIKSKLQIATIFSMIAALVIGSILFFSAQQVNEAIKKNRAADEIIKGLFELNILTEEYLIHHEERAKTQWEIKHDSLRKLLEEVELKTPEEIVFLKRMRENHEYIRNTFSRIVSNYEGYRNEKRDISEELNEMLEANLDTKSHSMVSDAYQLAEIINARLVASQEKAYSLVLFFSLIMAMIVATVSFSIYGTVVKPIRKLHEGTEIIGGGNLDFKVGTMAKDEVGQLSRAFDRMTIQLKESFAGLGKEIAERKRVEEEVHRLNAELEKRVRDRTAQLEAANKELESFSYSVSHDLRAPLRSIDGFSLALEEDYAQKVGDQGKDYIRRIRAATQRMAELIDALLTLSRLTRSEINNTSVDLSAVTRSIAADLQKMNPERRVKFNIAEAVKAKGDARLLRVVLENLLGNAWKFTAKCQNACIELGVSPQSDGKYAYFVRDNGAGFDMRYIDKLFGAFQRLHGANEFPGTGIGLATVQHIIHRHGGRVWAEGSVGQGATFYFTLEG
jgi:signal transduction histidine kinase